MPDPLPLTESRAASRRSPLLWAIALLWLLLWTMIEIVQVAPLLHSPRVPGWHPIVIVMISTGLVGAWLAWALGTRRFERVPLDPPRRWIKRQLWPLPLLIAIGIPLVLTLRQAFYRLIGTDYGYAPPNLFIPFEAVKYGLFYGLWIALMFGVLTLAKRREDSEKLLAVQKALAEAQLAQLQSQLRPHFLFNALNTVSALMICDPSRADRVLSQLGDLLRASLASGRPELLPLRDELKILRKYVDIMQERFGERAMVTWRIDESALDSRMPSMLLQPLLENAYKHGVERNTEPVHISISADRAGDQLRVEIRNTGSNLGNPSPQEGGVGITNCRERLRLLYAGAASLSVSDEPGGGVLARVTLPCPQAAA